MTEQDADILRKLKEFAQNDEALGQAMVALVTEWAGKTPGYDEFTALQTLDEIRSGQVQKLGKLVRAMRRSIFSGPQPLASYPFAEDFNLPGGLGVLAKIADQAGQQAQVNQGLDAMKKEIPMLMLKMIFGGTEIKKKKR